MKYPFKAKADSRAVFKYKIGAAIMDKKDEMEDLLILVNMSVSELPFYMNSILSVPTATKIMYQSAMRYLKVHEESDRYYKCSYLAARELKNGNDGVQQFVAFESIIDAGDDVLAQFSQPSIRRRFIDVSNLAVSEPLLCQRIINRSLTVEQFQEIVTRYGSDIPVNKKKVCAIASLARKGGKSATWLHYFFYKRVQMAQSDFTLLTLALAKTLDRHGLQIDNNPTFTNVLANPIIIDENFTEIQSNVGNVDRMEFEPDHENVVGDITTTRYHMIVHHMLGNSVANLTRTDGPSPFKTNVMTWMLNNNLRRRVRYQDAVKLCPGVVNIDVDGEHLAALNDVERVNGVINSNWLYAIVLFKPVPTEHLDVENFLFIIKQPSAPHLDINREYDQIADAIDRMEAKIQTMPYTTKKIVHIVSRFRASSARMSLDGGSKRKPSWSEEQNASRQRLNWGESSTNSADN